MAVAVVLFVVGGCIAELADPVNPTARPIVPSGRPRPSVVASPIDTAAPTPGFTLAPTPPLNLARTATAEAGDVRITIELDRNPMPAGQPTRVTTTIKNTGRDPVIYYPCGKAVEVGGHIAEAPWRPGRDLPEPALTWKTDLLEHLLLDERVRQVWFLPAGEDGSASGCGDVAHVATVAPGASFRERSHWDGLSFRRLAPPPTALIDLVASLEFDRGNPAIEHPPEDRHLLQVHVKTWIAGLPDTFLDPGEAVDIALADPRLTEVLASHDLRNGNAGLVRYDPATGAYQIGLIEENVPVPRAHLVLVDGRTGAIIEWVERAWDFTVDGNP